MIYKFKDKTPIIHESCFIAPSADLIGEVVVGEEANIWYGAVLRADGNAIYIGKGTNIQDHCTLHIHEGTQPTEVGDYVTVGHGAIVHGCKIGDFCLIGMGAIILNEAEIGEYTIVGAGSLVPQGKKIPSGVLCMGSPAKVVRQLTEDEKKSLEASAKYYIEQGQKYK